MAPFQLGCVGVGSENAFSNRSLFALMGTPTEAELYTGWPCRQFGPVVPGWLAGNEDPRNRPGMGGRAGLGISCLEPGFLRGVLGFSVDVRDVAGGRLAEMRTAGVGLNTRQMGAGIGE